MQDVIKCPCCGQQAPRTNAVQVDIDENRLHYRGHSLKLTNRLAELALILARRMPATVPHETVISQMFGACEGMDAQLNINVGISELRKLLRPIGLQITNTYGVGFRLSEVVRTETIQPLRPSKYEEDHARA